MTYNILAINPGHNGSAALTVDGELVFYIEEERLSRLKYDGNPFKAMLQVLINYPVDELVIGGTTVQLPELPWTLEDPYTALVRKFNPNVKVTKYGNTHHIGHAASAFYNSGFETAIAVVIDGAGSYKLLNNIVGGFETESVYKCSYPADITPVYKRYADGRTDYYSDDTEEFDSSVTITKAYEAVSEYLGFGFIEAGKTMGLSPYGKQDSNIPEFFVQNKGNKNLLKPWYPAGAYIDESRFTYLKRHQNPADWHVDPSKITDVDKNLAYHIQKEAEEQLFSLIDRVLTTNDVTNIVISGGFGLNCVANYKLLKKFPSVKFFIDPVSHDGGTSIGLAKYAWYQYSQSKKVSRLTSLYLGTTPDYSQLQHILNQVDNLDAINVTYDNVADLIANGNIVALFQGLSEGGPRALGNRSILFDPRNPDGKDIVNSVKHREWFRPFAASVLHEHATEWFDMAGLDASPHMMYAINVKEDKQQQIPSVVHVDGTCRVQTVSADQNAHYYQLINSFFKQTGIPLLFNTSFNLAGEPLVETIIDAASTIIRSQINYLYLPDLNLLLRKKHV